MANYLLVLFKLCSPHPCSKLLFQSKRKEDEMNIMGNHEPIKGIIRPNFTWIKKAKGQKQNVVFHRAQSF